MSKLLLALYAVCLVLFAVLSFFAGQGELPGEHSFIHLVADNLPSIFLRGLRAVSELGSTVPAAITVAAAVAVLLVMRRRAEALLIGALPVVAWLVSAGFKVLLDRARPGHHELVSGTSYPSGHTIHATVFGGVVFFLAPRLIRSQALARTVQALAVLYVLLMGTSRIALMVHWPTDVVGGFLLGVLLLLPATRLYTSYVNGRQAGREVGDA